MPPVLSSAEAAVCARVATLVGQMADLRAGTVPYCELHIPVETLRRARTLGRLNLVTLARICDRLEFDLEIRVRDRTMTVRPVR